MVEYIQLFVGAFFAATLSGAAGFGGALLLLPLLVAVVGVSQAVPLLTVAQFVGNMSRAALGARHIQWKWVGWFLLGAIPASWLGALWFVQIPREWVTRVIGGAMLFYLILNYLGVVKLHPSTATMIVGGGVTGLLSGLIGSAGPLGAAIFLALGLPPVAYIASEATSALVMHGIKTLVYQQYLNLDQAFWRLAVCLGVAMILGSWLAQRLIKRIPREQFNRYVGVLLAAIAMYMLVHG